jgi:HAD superfamily hydrolase (TIGR01509 family)
VRDVNRVVLFDLGGVIVDLAGLEQFLDRHRLERATFWPAWLELGAGNKFESGRSTPAEFAASFLRQFEIDLTPEEFLTEFSEWPSGLLPGAEELVDDVRSVGAITATLSNTNPIHWNSVFSQNVIVPMFDRHFPSFELGMAKPARALFERVVNMLAVNAAEVTFLDDNLVNVEAAREAGLAAFHVRSPDEARLVLLGPS